MHCTPYNEHTSFLKMQYSLGLSAVVLFVGAVVADTHPECWCKNGDSYNWRMSTNACTTYSNAGYEWGTATYNESTGHCVADTGSAIAGDQWLAACKATATAGFACADGVGTCYANTDDVGSNCY